MSLLLRSRALWSVGSVSRRSFVRFSSSQLDESAEVDPATGEMFIRHGPVSPSATEPHEFTVGPANGFLPLHDPLARLPPAFDAMNDILDRMPVTIQTPYGVTPGLLALGKLGDAVHEKLPSYPISLLEGCSPQVLAALYRDLTFLTSAYLLEPCDLSFKATGSYGHGRAVLPAKLAQPLVYVADRLNAKPFMEYALSYALYNWQRKEIAKGLDYDNLALIRSFHGGPSEAGFILVHVAMVAHTGALVRHTERILGAVEHKNREELNAALTDYLDTMSTINAVMETMWTRSDPKDYMKLRTFIMGTKDPVIFPNGVIYEGVDTEPKKFRGESGANDSIIPTCDNLFDLHFPTNPLTDILRDFRTYRPVNHTIFLQSVYRRSTKYGVRPMIMEDPTSSLLFLSILDLVREFRWRHWNFTKEYIIKYSDHPVATGGSPIATWLPNQLSAVLTLMGDVSGAIGQFADSGRRLSPEQQEQFNTLTNRASTQLRVLTKEVEALRKRFGQD